MKMTSAPRDTKDTLGESEMTKDKDDDSDDTLGESAMTTNTDDDSDDTKDTLGESAMTKKMTVMTARTHFVLLQ